MHRRPCRPMGRAERRGVHPGRGLVASRPRDRGRLGSFAAGAWSRARGLAGPTAASHAGHPRPGATVPDGAAQLRTESGGASRYGDRRRRRRLTERNGDKREEPDRWLTGGPKRMTLRVVLTRGKPEGMGRCAADRWDPSRTGACEWRQLLCSSREKRMRRRLGLAGQTGRRREKGEQPLGWC